MVDFYAESASKRMKGSEGQIVSMDFKTPHQSRVVQARYLPPGITEAEVYEVVQPFGNISFLMYFSNQNMVLVEFEDLNSAIAFIEDNKVRPSFIKGHLVKFMYAKSETIRRPTKNDSNPSNVLLLTISNVMHHVMNVEVFHKITSNYGNVLRIVIFRKNGVQAMVEYDSEDSATRGMHGLDGADIYANSCSIKAEYAKPNRLNVKQNTSETWDYTTDLPQKVQKRTLLSEPSYPNHHNQQQGGFLMHSQGDSMGQMMSQNQGHGYPNVNYASAPDQAIYAAYYQQQQFYKPDPNNPYGYSAEHGIVTEEPNCVLMIYGLDPERMNCKKLFNLLCLYGNVVKTRFLKSKPGSAMAQMSNRLGCDNAIKFLKGTFLYGNVLSLSLSVQQFIEDLQFMQMLPDGTPCANNFALDKGNRFTSGSVIRRIRITPPSNLVYFFNCPPNVDEAAILQPFVKADIAMPSKARMLPKASEKSSRGILEFEDLSQAMEAVVNVNNTKMDSPYGNGIPFVMRLSFTDGAEK